MKKAALLILWIMSLSSVFAGECVSKNLVQEKERLLSIQGISDEEFSLLYKTSENVKVMQILACAGSGDSISDSDAVFAIRFIENDRTSKIYSIKNEEQQLESLLLDGSIDNIERDVYNRALSRIAKRLDHENELADTIIKHIKRANR